jgi:hypothetical protein
MLLAHLPVDLALDLGRVRAGRGEQTLLEGRALLVEHPALLLQIELRLTNRLLELGDLGRLLAVRVLRLLRLREHLALRLLHVLLEHAPA